MKNLLRKNPIIDGIESVKSWFSGDENLWKSFDGRTPPDEQEALQKKALDEYRNGIPEHHKDLRDLYPDQDEQEDSSASPDKSSMIAPNKYVGMFNQNHRPETEILLKSAQNTGENEINAARKFTMFDNKDQALGKLMNERISSWYDTMYGTNPMQRDASGRQIEPAAKMQAQPMLPLTKDGMDLAQGLGKLSQQMAAVDADDSAENGISALQKNLNVLGAEPALKVDSILGPKTALQTRRYLADNGYSQLAGAFRNKLYAG